MYVVGLVILIVGLLISVALHELGHLIPAKKFGGIVPEFWVGFGKTLYSKKIGGTTYGVKAVLLGGYVRILGMFAPPRAGVKAQSAGGKVTAAEEAREQSESELAQAYADGYLGKPFYQLRTGQKLVVMLGGPAMNLLLAVILMAIVLMGFGTQQPTTTVAEVVPTVNGSSETTGSDSQAETVPGPAAEAGIQAGDTIISWNGVAAQSWDDLRALIGASSGSVDVVVRRGGEEMAFTVEPVVTAEGQVQIGIISEVQRVRASVPEVFGTVWQQFTATTGAIVRLPVALWDLGESLFTGAPRDPNGVVSVVGVARLAGEIASVDSGGTTVSLGDRAAMLLSLLASLNMALFVFNLIPLPPFDGGHIAGALWGGIRNTWAKMRGQAVPPPPDTATLIPLTYGVWAVLIVMTVILIAADLFKPLQLF